MKLYVLGPNRVVVPVDLMQWARWFETADADRRVAWSEVAPGLTVSTVFLGIDHRFGDGPPLVFETMVFGDYGGDREVRYSTWDEAAAGHRQMVDQIRKEISGIYAR